MSEVELLFRELQDEIRFHEAWFASGRTIPSPETIAAEFAREGAMLERIKARRMAKGNCSEKQGSASRSLTLSPTYPVKK